MNNWRSFTANISLEKRVSENIRERKGTKGYHKKLVAHLLYNRKLVSW